MDYTVRKGNLGTYKNRSNLNRNFNSKIVYLGALRVLLDYCPQLIENCWSALFYASIRGDFDLAYVLLTYGVDPNMIESKTRSGLMHEVVRFENKADSEPNFSRLKIIKFLAIYGGNPDFRNARKEVNQIWSNF